jgi:hypothetical protein
MQAQAGFLAGAYAVGWLSTMMAHLPPLHVPNSKGNGHLPIVGYTHTNPYLM